jgi:hypothetical protein
MCAPSRRSPEFLPAAGRFWDVIMERCLRVTVLALTSLGWLGSLPWSRQPDATSLPMERITELEGPAVVDVYCSGCHRSGRAKVDLDGLVDERRVRRDWRIWDKALAKVRAGEMPPPGRRPELTPPERAQLVRWLEQGIEAAHQTRHGRFLARRLSQQEYRNSVRDLVGVTWQPADDFPADDTAWDRSIEPPTLRADTLKKYSDAAENILANVDVARLPVSAAPGERESIASAATQLAADRARDLLAGFARRAFRRPLETNELDSLIDVYEQNAAQGRSFGEAVKGALQRVLTSPHFLFLIEKRLEPGSDAGLIDLQNQLVLASRLSHFLWRSTPDEELLLLAEQGALRRELAHQLERMLHDPRAQGFGAGFVGYWLELGRLQEHGDDALLFQAMRRETERFLDSIIHSQRSVLDVLDADYTFLDERLARHYGIAGVYGAELRPVSLKGTQRAGLLTHASILTLTSVASETSAVRRGKWVLENLLGEPPAAPPTGLLEAFDKKQDLEGGTHRLRLEKHRSDQSCAHCHAKLDSIGFSLDNFDGTGAWRTHINKRVIDAAVVMPGGESVDGPVQLAAYLRGKKEQFLRCLAGKLLGYALGRKLDDPDWTAMERIAEDLAGNEPTFSELLVHVVASRPFQNIE